MKIHLIILISPILSLGLTPVAIAKENPQTNQKINLYNPLQRANNFDECQDIFPEQDPEKTIQPTFINSNKWQLRRLCSNEFAVLYSGLSKTPLLVIEKLNAKTLAHSITRNDDFFADPRLPNQQRAQLSDYRGLTDIDRGHLAPARNSASMIGMAQTFALSNIVPQNAQNNRNAWKKIESDTYKYASRTQSHVYVFTGVLFEKKEHTEKVGKNKVWKPSHLYKVIYHPEKNKSWAFIIANKANQPIKQISYLEFTQKTGIKFGVLEKDFKAQKSSSLSHILAGTFIFNLFEDFSVGTLVAEAWQNLKQTLSTYSTSFFKSIVTWLKDHDKNDNNE